MGSVRGRVERVEARISPRASPGECPPWRTPEQEAARERQFSRLYMQIGGKWPPETRSREEVFEELFAEIEKHREGTDRKEMTTWKASR